MSRARAEDATSQIRLGLHYEHGDGVRQDLTQAAQWFRNAADQGYASAQYDLGVMYAKGIGVPKDEAVAMQWISKAADRGDERAVHVVRSLAEDQRQNHGTK